ncbi:uncharacterized protein LOC103717918 isoform X2 [Phoenix dactylifera]|uniref:Uncharacterized protein LOC103717918 isoform X2 n=1 Tax=Phoenix dactylifera TaxID=42345 RepID=A0A8B9AHU5_PHODC|nr:uncharacterized protein LOC103717918 isoform X2 [Phoenix dactylifera]
MKPDSQSGFSASRLYVSVASRKPEARPSSPVASCRSKQGEGERPIVGRLRFRRDIHLLGFGMGSESLNLEERLRSLLLQLQTESGILDRIVYKGKNQHRRCSYFQYLLKVRRDVRLLLSAGLGEVLNVLFPIIHGRKPAQNAFQKMRQKKKCPSGKHNYQERLLGIARLLSQMAEPILKAAIQISLLLAKSFFTGFCIMTLALLARLRVLVQQVSSLSRKKHSVKLTQDGVEAFRDYHPSGGDVLILECVWEEDKFVLSERTERSNENNQDEDFSALSLETSRQYETIELFSEVLCTANEVSSDNIEVEIPAKDSCSHRVESAVDSSEDQSNISDDKNIVDYKDGKQLESQEVPSSAAEGILPVSVDSFSETGSRKKVAFIPVRESKSSETSTWPNKKMKLEMPSPNATGTEDSFLDLLMSGSMTKSIF